MFYIIVNVLFTIITLFLILFGVLNQKTNNNFHNNLYIKFKCFIDKNYKILVVILFALTIFTSVFKLGSVPYGLHVDEAGMAYDALSISKYGIDRYLNKLPIYLINYGGGQSAMYAYLVALLINVFGYSIQIIRMPAVIFRILIFISGFFIIKSENNKFKTLIFLSLLAIVPYFIMQSRWGLDCNLLVGFLSLAICFLIKSIIKNTNKLLLVFSGIFFGLSLYTYALSYIIVPILLFFICIYLLYIKKINLKKIIILGVPIFILSLPLILMICVNNGFIHEIKEFITIPLLTQYRGSEISLTNIPNNIYILLSILSFDKDPILVYNSISHFGTIYYFAIPFFIIGIVLSFKKFYISIKQKKFNINTIFIFWFLSVLICQLLIVDPNINKANAIFVPIIYFLTIGIIYIFRKIKLLILPILLMFSISFGLFFNYYYYRYDNENKNQFFFATCYLDALDYSKSLGKEHIYIDYDLTAQEYIYILLNNNVSPYEYAEDNIKTTYNDLEITYSIGIPNHISLNCVYIIGNKDDLLSKFRNLNFDYMNFGDLTVFYYKDNINNF